MALIAANITLENARVRLVPLSFEFYDEIEHIALDPELWTLAISPIHTHAQLDAYLINALTEKADGIGYPFVIIDKLTGEVAGSTRFNNIVPDHKRLEIGWTFLAKRFRGTGLNLACKYELLRFAFETLQFNRVELKTDVLNLQSRRAMEKIGAKPEGILRNHMLCHDGRLRDTIYYSILQSEWHDLRTSVFEEYAPT